MEAYELDAVTHTPIEELANGVRRGLYVAPLFFAGELYTWGAGDFDRLRDDCAGVVINARPYSTLLLALAIPDLVPVWLELDEGQRRARLHERGDSRDMDPKKATLRQGQDDEDSVYRDLFAIRLESNSSALDKLLQLVEHGPDAR